MAAATRPSKILRPKGAWQARQSLWGENIESLRRVDSLAVVSDVPRVKIDRVEGR